MSRRKGYYRREFLNEEGGMAAIEVNARSAHPTMAISDCERKVELEFSVNYTDEAGVQNIENKIDLLYALVGEFRREVKKNIRARRKEEGWPSGS